MKPIITLMKKEAGQGLVEYALILFFIAITTISSLYMVGERVLVLFGSAEKGMESSLEAGSGAGDPGENSMTGPTIHLSDENWTNKDITVTISDSNKGISEVDKTKYRTKGPGKEWSAWEEYSGAFYITKEGRTSVEARTIYKGGSVSPTSQKTGKIDRTPPVIELSQEPEGLWTNEDVTIRVRITDNVGIKTQKWAEGSRKVSCFIGGGTGLEGKQVKVEDNGWYTFYAVDKAGNETLETLEIKNIDKVDPVVEVVAETADGKEYKGGTWTDQKVNLSLRATDDNLQFFIVRDELVEVTKGMAVKNLEFTEGRTKIEYMAVDKAKNIVKGTFLVKIDPEL